MASSDLRQMLELVGAWEGFEIEGWSIDEGLAADAFGLSAPRLTIALRPKADIGRRCSRCGAVVDKIHDVSERRVRELPLLQYDVWLVVPQARVTCPQCGPTIEAIPWLDRYQRLTKRLAETLARLAQVMPITQVAARYHVDWDTVKQIDKRALAARLGPLDQSDFSTVRRIAVDEFALHRGQTYATIVVDADTKRVVWLHRGRDSAALGAFFTALGPAGCQRLEAVVMDLARPFVKAVRTHCPHVAIVYDLYHAMARYAAQVLDRVRMDEANSIARPNRHENRLGIEDKRRLLTGKGVRWLLLRDRRNLRGLEDHVKLDELMKANQNLFTVYVLKEALRSLWTTLDPSITRPWSKFWYLRASESCIAPLDRFAKRLALS